MATNQSEVSTDTINIYFLAAPEDEQQCIAVKKYLGPVIRNSKRPIEIESDFEIPPGQDVKQYKEKLYQADIVLAFISADFINDDETYLRTQKVIERYNRNETVMLPILVRNCMWKSTPFVNLPFLPKNIQPLNNKQFWNSEDDALTAVVTDIYEAIQNFSYEDKEESDLAEEKVSELLTETHIERTPPEPETNGTASDNEAPHVEKTKEKVETKNVAQHPPKAKPKNIQNVAMDVDWRKSYFKDVLWKRAVAFILDNIITAIPSILIAVVLWSLVSVLITDAEDVSDTEFTFITLFSFFFYFIICAIFESSKYRGTFGKQIMKLEITDRNGHRVSFLKAFVRNIFRMLTAISYLLVIPFILQIFTFLKTKKFFHDQISYTVVGEKMKR
ncbi:RDD family protein [Aequorivita todarodis]|uniref:RDD family protein n=1 Tax=Aequorivita todarodis TaxID=2036821 RepID=UPI002350AD65|nr:RDD family protein [Aequorivita todarodis]MDC7999722.1 RDD family protein [Aequorivita todarodis]